MKKITYLFLLLLPLASCHNSKKAQENTVVSPGNDKPGNMRFIVSFTSIGTGTNRQAIERLEKFIPQFEEKNKVKLDVQTTRWGKEGEIDYCFKLDELKAKQQESFIAEVKELLKDANRVLYKENSPCRQAMKSVPANNFPKE